MKLLSITVGLILLIAPASAGQLSLLGAGKPGAAAPAGYTGPGDIATFDGWWSPSYAYSTAKRGTKTMNVCNVADVVCADVSSDATTGLVADPTIGGVLCGTTIGVNVCTVKTIYDQSGGTIGDLTQATISARATLVSNCPGQTSTICANFAGSGSQGYQTTSTYAQATPWSTFDIVERTGNFTSQNNIMQSSGTGIQMGAAASANTAIFYGGAVANQTMSDSAWHVQQASNNPASPITAVDGTQVSPGTNNLGNLSFSGTVFAGDQSLGGGRPFTGNFSAIGVASSGLSSATLTSLSSNSHSILGF